MRDFEQRKEEIFARSQEKIARRKKNIKRIVMTCVPLVLCVCLAGGFLAMGSPFATKDMAMENMSAGDIYYGAAVPESPEMAPIDNEPLQSNMRLELYRYGRAYAYTETEHVDMFQQILEGESIQTPEVSTPDDIDDIIYNFNSAPGQLIEDEPYAVKLQYPDGQEVWYILRGSHLTSQDGEVYTLTQEQASILHKLMEVEWP